LGVTVPDAITPVTGGWDTALWRVQTGASTSALRVFRAEQGDTFRREARAMRAAAQAGIPVPTIQAEGICAGRPALLLSWCAGLPLLDAVRARLWRIWKLGLMMGRMHARIHAVHVPASASLPAWAPRTEDADAALHTRLRALTAESPRVLLHLDYHPLNIMVDATRITGVLDWANVAVGDPRVDIARTVAILRLAPTPPGPTPAALIFGLRRVLEAAWRSGYEAVTGPLTDMAPFYAWAGAMMERDLSAKLGRPGIWLQPGDLAGIHRWTQRWSTLASHRRL
jgi:aminoglycoside phosphotransferase (APT) family kinase protein